MLENKVINFCTSFFSNCLVYVPRGSAKKYRNAEGWMHFKNIKEL